MQEVAAAKVIVALAVRVSMLAALIVAFTVDARRIPGNDDDLSFHV